MIKDLGFRKVAIKSLRLPGDLRELIQDPSVVGLAEGIRDIGQAHPVIMRKSDHAIIAGRRRLAAAIRGKQTRVWVRWVECDDLDKALMSRSENLHRRHNVSADEQNRIATELVELMSRRIRETDPIPRKPNGRPTTARVVARNIVASIRGVTPETLRVYESRARRAAGKPPLKAGRPAFSELVVGPQVETLGVEPDEGWMVKLVETAAQIETALRMVRQAKHHLESMPGPLPKVSQQHLVSAADSLAAQLRTLKPATVCPYCKALEPLVEDCEACSGSGWLGEGQMSGIPRELLDEDNPKVMVDGEIVDAEERVDEEPEPQHKPMDLFG